MDTQNKLMEHPIAVKDTVSPDFIVSGSIGGNTPFIVKNSNGDVIEKGIADNSGILTVVLKDQPFMIEYGDISIPVELDASGFFAFQQKGSSKGLKSNLSAKSGGAAIAAKFVGKQLASGIIGSMGSLAFDKILEATFGPDETQQKLDDLLNGQQEIKGLLTDIQKQLDTGFDNIDKQFQRLFKHNLKESEVYNKTRIESLTNGVTIIENTMQSEMYDEFWNTSGEKYETDGKSEEEIINVYATLWKDLGLYGKQKEFTLETFGSLEYILNHVFNKVLMSGDFEIETQQIHLDEFIENAETYRNEEIVEKEFVKNAVNGVNLASNVTGIGEDKPTMNKPSDGLYSSILYTGYLDFLNINNLIAEINFFLLNFGIITQYKDNKRLIEVYNDSVSDMTDKIKRKMGGKGWPGISRVESYYEGDFTGYGLTIIEAQIINESSLPDAKTLAYDINKDDKRAKCFTHVQQRFFQKVVHEDQRYTQFYGYKAEYKLGNTMLATYYAAASPPSINELFVS